MNQFVTLINAANYLNKSGYKTERGANGYIIIDHVKNQRIRLHSMAQAIAFVDARKP